MSAGKPTPCEGSGQQPALLEKVTTTPATDERALFIDWANAEGYDTAHTYDTDRSVWIFLNPMTADLWKAWQAARSHPAALAVHEVVGWRPIETAPHDGKDLLVHTAQGLTRLAFFDQARGGIWSCWPGRENLEATHWMPLPAAPSKPDAFASAGKPMPGATE